ncbi:hypothetical protein [Glutamicibacter sp. NPDC127525]|uniref:hypothetical protein n=1 Tax=unclassified Glutamicibacter TaxID=2627139 RepID=UPI003632DDEE
MSQPIDVGSVLSGRYQVTESVLSSAEGDLVLGGVDQVLNRSVSIMVASVENSSQLATSAREIAMGERASNVQVLDLGITDANQTYLVANTARSSDLLDLVLETDDAPYVEPFFTDTLGTEIFGESRQAVPETYEDDNEYYDQLQYEDEPEQQGKIGSALAGGFAGLKNRFGKKNQEQPEEEQFDQTAPNEQVPATMATPVAPAEKPAAEDKPKVSRLEDEDEPNVTATAALAAAAQSKGKTPAKPTQKPAEEDEKPAKKKAAAAGAVAGAGAAAGAVAGAGAAAGAAAAAAPKASTFPAAAKNAPAQDPQVGEEEEEEGGSKGTRLLVGAVLLIVLIVAVVFAFNFLGGDKNTTADGEQPTAVESPEKPSETEKEKDSTEDALPAPKIDDVSRLVPGNQQLNSETDGKLGQMIDGNASSTYSTYSYTTADFGGFASNMVFILELDEKSKISEVNLEGLNGTGGNYEILVGESEDLGDAKSVAKGSFSGPSVSVTAKDDDKDYMEGTHVFLDITDLPRKASGGNDSRPFGLQIGEFSAK